jgi:predicted ATPase
MNENYVSQIKINGYKSIKSCNLKLKELNVLIGPNGGGKTNFIDFFQLLNHLFDSDLQAYIAKSHGADELLRFGREVTPQLSGEFSMGTKKYGFTLEPTPDDKMLFADEFIGSEESCVRHIGSGHFETRINDYDDQVARINCRVFHFQDLGRDSRIMLPQPLDADNKKLSHDAGNLASYLYYLRENYNKNYNIIVKRIQVVAPFFVDFYFNIFNDHENREMVELKWLERGYEKPHKLRNFSTGTLSFACLMTVLKSPREISDDIVLFDEPDLNLHPAGLRVFANILKVAKNYTQVIISTNSSEMLNQFEVEDLIVADRSGGATFLSRIDRDEIDEWAQHCTLSQIWENNIIGGRPIFNPGQIYVDNPD